MCDSKKVKWDLIAAFLLLNTSFTVLFLLFFAHVQQQFQFHQSAFLVKVFSFLVSPIIVGFLLDYSNKTKRTFFLRLYLKFMKLLFVFITLFVIWLLLFPEYQEIDIAVAALFAMVILVNLFYVPVKAFFDYLAPTNQLPFILALLSFFTIPVFVFSQEVYAFAMGKIGVGTLIFMLIFTLITAYFFHKKIKLLKSTDFKVKLTSTSWNKIVWMAFMLGFGLVAVLYLYPSFYKMFNEGHGVSQSEAAVFGKWIMMAVVALLLPIGLLVSKVGVSKFIKTNNTVLLVTVISSVFFPDYFHILTCIVVLSLSLALVTNLPVAYYHISSQHRGVGAGLFFGIVFSLLVIADYFL